MDEPVLTPAELDSRHWGSEQFYRHWLKQMVYTEGVQDFAQSVGGYWFLDIVATECWQLHKAGEEFLHIKLIVKEGERGATILVDDGNDNVLMTKTIEFTDCPPGEWRFYLENDTLLLPGER